MFSPPVVCRELNSQASKVFLTSDLCENRYLCFLVESHQHLRSVTLLQGCCTSKRFSIIKLTRSFSFAVCCFHRCVKFMESNDTSQLIFASVTTIPAKDAEPLQVDFNTLSCCYYFFVHSTYL